MKRLILVLLICLVCSITQAQLAVEKLKYPVSATTTNEKLEFCYIAQEKLRLEHNAKGKDHKDGKISDAEWKAYLKNEFDPKQSLIIRDLVMQKNKLRKSTKYEVNLNDLEKE